MKSIIQYGIALLLLSGCNKFVDVPLPISQLSTVTTYADDEKAASAIRGIYASTQNGWGIGPFSGTISGNAGMSADELIRIAYSADQDAFFQNNLTPATGPIAGGIWGSFYNIIYQANSAVVNLEKSPGVTPAKKLTLISEAKFLRAISYFYLLNLYGEVPLTTTTDYMQNALLSRTDTGKIWQQIESDLRYAVTNGSTLYSATGTRSRANSYSASALLARVQLYRKNWADAETLATNVLGTQLFKLDTLGGIMLSTSTEPIFYISNAGTNLYAIEGQQLHGVSLQYRISPALAAAFEPGDQRFVQWTKPASDNKPALSKYKILLGSGVGAKKEATVVLRVAEQYLIRAEARAQRDNLAGAIADVDMVRQRAGLPLIADTNPGISKTDLLDAILHERFVELFGEFGHRWLDVKRSGKADLIFGASKPGWESTDALYPIPQSDRNNNPNLGQNDGY